MGARSGFLLALVTVAAITTRVPAQEGQPEQRVAAFFEALAGQRWTQAANVIHPARLESFQDEQVSWLIAVIRRHEELRKAGIALRPGHEYDGGFEPVLRAETLAEYSAAPIGGIGAARTIGAASALPAAEFMSHWLAARANDPDSLYRRRFAQVPRRIVGGVIEADSLAHVLYRVASSHVHTRDPADVEIIRLRKHESEWYLWPDPNNFDFRTGAAAFVRLQLPVNRSSDSGRD